MTAIFIRFALYIGIALIIYLGIRKIWRDWTSTFKKEDDEARRLRRERDLRERAQPGVIDLKRDKDGTFRPGDDNKR
jgi:hypothetical protein